VKLLSFVLGGGTYEAGHVFTTEELVQVTPGEIVRYLKIKVYGEEDAQPDIDPPLHYRSNTIKFWKKAWSYFMPNNIMPWNEVAKIGNPTRSTAVNKLLKAVKKKEAARLGRPSQARRAFQPSEYSQAIMLLSECPSKENGVWLAAYICFQYNMIARLDDTSKFRSPDLQPFQAFPFYGVSVRLCWSKNVLEERDAPNQVLFGANDWRYCTLSLLATWLEFRSLLHPEENEFFFGACGMIIPNPSRPVLRITYVPF